MAAIERNGSCHRYPLFVRHVVGRSRAAHLRLSDPSVSAQHAILAWTGRAWEAYDLGSRNGTAVNGHRLERGERAELITGALLRFGAGTALWRIVDAGAPAVMALPSSGGPPIVGENDRLLLPNEEAPLMTIYRDASTDWVLDHGGFVERIESGRCVTAGDEKYTLYLPDLFAYDSAIRRRQERHSEP